MKKFIYKILSFSICLLICLVGIYSYWFSQPETSVKIPTQNIIIGDSNTRWSMSDKILSSYSNYSTGGETYLFAYRKLCILSKNNKIDTLLLSFNPHNTINNMWWNDKDGTPIDNRMPAFYSDFSQEEHLDLLQETPMSYLKSILKIGKSKVETLFSVLKTSSNTADDMVRFGSYHPNPENETQHEFKPYQYQKPIVTEVELKYLKKIIKECQNKNIHLILIQPPKNYLRKDYKNYDHEAFYDTYYQHFSNVDFLDFSKLQLPPHAYWDINHTDIVGAEYFSSFIQKQGIRNLLDSKFNLKHKTQ
ncbi:hypothetical protein BPO_1801 [Bergeyella porcorum]|uniref:SGNH/GDSL hydrolase family protein n=1 Tax=Bergeyella porcorum TaxID=1735111 RepID=A0AAU0F152_9FLAO